MSMDPRDFHELAQMLLAGDPVPAGTRTAISRAYYAAYNVGAQALERLQFPVPTDRTGHDFVRGGLANAGDQKVEAVGKKLGDLAGMRIHADYRMENTKVETPGTARTWVLEAGRIIEAIDAALADPTRCKTMTAAILRWPMTANKR